MPVANFIFFLVLFWRPMIASFAIRDDTMAKILPPPKNLSSDFWPVVISVCLCKGGESTVSRVAFKFRRLEYMCISEPSRSRPRMVPARVPHTFALRIVCGVLVMQSVVISRERFHHSPKSHTSQPSRRERRPLTGAIPFSCRQARSGYTFNRVPGGGLLCAGGAQFIRGVLHYAESHCWQHHART